MLGRCTPGSVLHLLAGVLAECAGEELRDSDPLRPPYSDGEATATTNAGID